MKKPIKKWYLKWYYGYKNFGDELLALGVISYLFKNYPLEKLYIEVENIDWFSTRLHRHKSLLWDTLSKVELISMSNKVSIIKHSILTHDTHLFLWWGEVFTPARWWFHWGRNLYILYRLSFIRHNVTLLWWVSKANNRPFKLLYRLTLSNCDKIILREPTSYDYVVSTYASKDKTLLYQDFWHALIDSLHVSKLTDNNTPSKTRPLCPYLVVNTNPHIDMSILTQKLSKLTQKTNIDTIVYFPWDKVDTKYFDALSTQFSTYNWTLFDWTKYDILTIIDLFQHAIHWLWVRLHVLSMFQRFWIPYDFVVYQEKISKFLALWDKKGGESEKLS